MVKRERLVWSVLIPLLVLSFIYNFVSSESINPQCPASGIELENYMIEVKYCSGSVTVGIADPENRDDHYQCYCSLSNKCTMRLGLLEQLVAPSTVGITRGGGKWRVVSYRDFAKNGIAKDQYSYVTFDLNNFPVIGGRIGLGGACCENLAALKEAKSYNVIINSYSCSAICGSSINSCASGKSIDVADDSASYKWNCQGVGTSSNQEILCSSPKPATPVNGVCHASEKYECSSGILNIKSDNGSHHLWECEGLSGGTTAQCSQMGIIAICSDERYKCGLGTPNPLPENNTHYKWYCNGSLANQISDDKICLKEKITSSLEKGYWENLVGDVIYEADKGDTVILVANGEDLEGKSINYTIREFKNQEGVWDKVISWIRFWESTRLSHTNGNEKISWTVPENNDNTKQFTTEITELGLINSSSNLTVRINSPSPNSHPEAILTVPTNSEGDVIRIKKGVSYEFKQESVDEDDLLSVHWGFGDGNETTIQNYSSYLNITEADVSHSYYEAGDYVVTLTVTEMNPPRLNPQSDSKSVRLVAFKEGINVVPIVSSPLDGNSYSSPVLFNASKSYAVNCSTHISSQGADFSVEDMGCKYILAPFALNPNEGFKAYVRWKEIDSDSGNIDWIRGDETEWEEWNSTTYGYSPSDENNHNGVVVFKKIYSQPKVRKILFYLDVESVSL